MKKTLMWARTGVVGAAVLGAACSGSSGHDDAGGSTEVLAVTASALSADVTGVNLSISGAGIAPTITTTLVKAGNKFQGIVTGIPAGSDRTFHGDGVDAAGAIAYAGDASGVTIAKGAKAFVALVLQQTRAPDPFHNSAPQIDAVSASSDTVEPGGSVTVTARASDPDGDPLTFSWTSTGGTFAAGSASTTTWTAGAEGTPTLTLRVRDTKGASAAISFVMNVHATTGTGIASISASFNDAPTVQSMTIDQTPLDVGQTAHLGLTATDIDGDAIASYAWTSTCTGTFADATAAAPAFTLSALPAAGRSCAFSVKITDARGGWNTGALSIQTGAPIDVSRPPVVDTTFQAADVADGGQSLTFRVKGHDPDGTAVAYSWTSPVGTFAPATTTANGESEVVWTAPACFYGTAVVSATLTDATGASTTQAFNVTAGVTVRPTAVGSGLAARSVLV